MSASTPAYEPLADPREQIRLVEVLPSNDPYSIECRFTTHTLSEAPPYIMLTNVWHDEMSKYSIRMENWAVPISWSLFRALRRSANVGPASWWIDSICINYVDRIELYWQINLVRDIHDRAVMVVSRHDQYFALYRCAWFLQGAWLDARLINFKTPVEETVTVPGKTSVISKRAQELLTETPQRKRYYHSAPVQNDSSFFLGSVERSPYKRWLPKSGTEACTACRERKIRCDGERPICLTCAFSRRRCTYYDEGKQDIAIPSPKRLEYFGSSLDRVVRASGTNDFHLGLHLNRAMHLGMLHTVDLDSSVIVDASGLSFRRQFQRAAQAVAINFPELDLDMLKHLHGQHEADGGRHEYDLKERARYQPSCQGELKSVVRLLKAPANVITTEQFQSLNKGAFIAFWLNRDRNEAELKLWQFFKTRRLKLFASEQCWLGTRPAQDKEDDDASDYRYTSPGSGLPDQAHVDITNFGEDKKAIERLRMPGIAVQEVDVEGAQQTSPESTSSQGTEVTSPGTSTSSSEDASLDGEDQCSVVVMDQKKQLLAKLMGHFHAMLRVESRSRSQSEGSEDRSAPDANTGIVHYQEYQDQNGDCNSNTNRSTTAHSIDTAEGRKGSSHLSSKQKGKQPMRDGEDGSQDGRDPIPRKRRRMKDNESAGPCFACPYYQRDPGRYRGRRSCVGPGWDEVRRVKEHLYRNHRQRLYCARCYADFDSESLLRAHERADVRCLVKPDRLPEGFDRDQEQALKCRKKKAPELTEEGKWRETYRILFPYDNEEIIPSPYVATNWECVYQTEQLDDLARYEQYMRRELPAVVSRQLELRIEQNFDMMLIEERLRSELVDIVRDAQDLLFRSYPSNASTTDLKPPHASKTLVPSEDAPIGSSSESVTLGMSDSGKPPAPGLVPEELAAYSTPPYVNEALTDKPAPSLAGFQNLQGFEDTHLLPDSAYGSVQFLNFDDDAAFHDLQDTYQVEGDIGLDDSEGLLGTGGSEEMY